MAVGPINTHENPESVHLGQKNAYDLTEDSNPKLVCVCARAFK